MLLFKYINVIGWRILKRSPFLLMITFFSFTIVGCNYENSKNSLPPHSKWQNYGGGSDQSKFVVLNDITKSNVDQLKIAWFYPTRDKISYAFNPIVVDTVMYVMARNNSLVALNAKNGKEIWIHS
ncbi:MAG: hypothetical protein ACTHM5_02210, partial [Ginsengibacter sp.]